MANDFAHYVRFKTRDGQYITGWDFQDFFVGQTRTFEGVDYAWAPMRWRGYAATLDGDEPQVRIASPMNAVSIAILNQAVEGLLLAEVSWVAITVVECTTPSEGSVIATDLFAVTSGGTDERTSMVMIELSSPFSTVFGKVPGRVLSEMLVGQVPATGSISLR